DVFTNWRTEADGALSTTYTSSYIRVGQAPIGGWPVVVHIPDQDADADTLTITWEESANGSTGERRFHTTQPVVTGASGAATSPRPDGLSLRDRLQNNLPYVRCVLTVTGGTPDFGAVTVGMDEGAFRNVVTRGVY